MTKERLNELTLELLEKNTNWRFDTEQASRDFAQFADGILTLRSNIVAEINREAQT
ncbi:MAG: hypothetical protein IKY90_08880 [Oscillospiraceae bacterium]|nr:hypothetical protein [Oscillospiraceae bacterium]